jgi:multiple sugar transport system ATP-binding protein
VAAVRFQHVVKRFPDGTLAVDDMNLEIEDGEFVVFVGPSGSGKSTALRMLAGLEDVTSGSIRIDDEEVNDVEPRSRDIAMVFQDYALYPHMRVSKNLGFGLKLRAVPKEERARRVEEVAKLMNIEDQLDRYPRQLSGGQRQRVAMGRAIVRHPRVLLMDEPLSNLDAKLRVHMRGEISRLHDEVRTTTIYVTHDQIEAMTMAERIVVMHRGRLEQVGSPEKLYGQPANVFVAGFMGSPAMNFLVAKLHEDGGRVVATIGSRQVLIPEATLAARPALRRYLGKQVVVGVRPEAFDGTATPGSENTLTVTVVGRELLGAEVILHCETDAQGYEPRGAFDLPPDERLALRADGSIHRLLARVDPRTPASKGEQIGLRLDASRLYLFNPADETAIVA